MAADVRERQAGNGGQTQSFKFCLRVSQHFVVGDQPLLRVCQSVIGRAGGGDFAAAVFGHGADGVDQLNDLIRCFLIRILISGRTAAPLFGTFFLGVVIRIVPDNAVAVFKELLADAEHRMAFVQRIHPAGQFPVIKLAKGDAIVGDALNIVSGGVVKNNAMLFSDYIQ